MSACLFIQQDVYQAAERTVLLWVTVNADFCWDQFFLNLSSQTYSVTEDACLSNRHVSSCHHCADFTKAEFIMNLNNQ